MKSFNPSAMYHLVLLQLLKAAFPEAKIYGQRDFAKKDCPSFDAKKEYEYISNMDFKKALPWKHTFLSIPPTLERMLSINSAAVRAFQASLMPLTLPLFVLTTMFCFVLCCAVADTIIIIAANNINAFFIIFLISLMQKYKEKMKIEKNGLFVLFCGRLSLSLHS